MGLVSIQKKTQFFYECSEAARIKHKLYEFAAEYSK